MSKAHATMPTSSDDVNLAVPATVFVGCCCLGFVIQLAKPVRKYMRGAAVIVIMGLVTFSFTTFLLGPVLPCLFTVPPFRKHVMRWYHWWCAYTSIFYFGLVSTCLETVIGVKVFIYGDQLVKGERALVLSNHRQVHITYRCLQLRLCYLTLRAWLVCTGRG